MSRGYLLFLLGMGCALAPELLWAQDATTFERDVRPILAEHCFACHGKDSPPAGLEYKAYFKDAAKTHIRRIVRAWHRRSGSLRPGKAAWNLYLRPEGGEIHPLLL